MSQKRGSQAFEDLSRLGFDSAGDEGAILADADVAGDTQNIPDLYGLENGNGVPDGVKTGAAS